EGGCHLLTQQTLDRETLGLDKFESLVHSSHFAVDLCRCRDCGQVYVEVFWEIVDWSGGDDDMWQFYVPVSDEETERLRSTLPQHDPASGKAGQNIFVSHVIKLVESRRHIVRYPSNRVYWREGPEIAFTVPV